MHHGAPLVDRDRMLAEKEWGNGDAMLRPFRLAAVGLAFRRAHQECATRYPHHREGRALAEAFDELLRMAAAALGLVAFRVERDDVEAEGP
jgi:hypothetical protein